VVPARVVLGCFKQPTDRGVHIRQFGAIFQVGLLSDYIPQSMTLLSLSIKRQMMEVAIESCKVNRAMHRPT